MSRYFPLAMALLAILASSHAFAGHEWTDGTMGPPQGRGYDTTMPQLPSRARHSPTPPAPNALCSNRPDLKSDTPAAAADLSSAEIAAVPSPATKNPKPADACSVRAR